MPLSTTFFLHLRGPPLPLTLTYTWLLHPRCLPKALEFEAPNSSALAPLCTDGKAKTQVMQWAGSSTGTRAPWLPRGTFPHIPCSQDPSSPDAYLALRESKLRPACLLGLLGIPRSLLSLVATLWPHLIISSSDFY